MRVYLSKFAENKMDNILNFIEINWSVKQKDKFLNTFVKTTEQLSAFPKSSKKSSDYPSLYKCVVSKQTSVYYRIHISEIEILNIVDNRQNPLQVEAELSKLF